MVGKLMMTPWSAKLKLENIFMIIIQCIEWEINFKENRKKKKEKEKKEPCT